MKRTFLILIVLLAMSNAFAQRLITEDVKTHKIRKVKIGKRVGIYTTTDTLYSIRESYDSISKQLKYENTGDWILRTINDEDGNIEVENELSGEIRIIDTRSIKELIFRREDDARYKQLILFSFLGGLAWAAASDDQGQDIAAASIMVACAGYMVATWTWPTERGYKFIRIEK